MNEKEKQVVERIEDTFYSDLGKGINKFQKITLYEDSIKDVRIILNLIEKLQKENEELRESNRKLYEIGQEMCKQDKYTSENYIPVQKVKDKIEEILNNGEYRIIFEGDAEFPDEATTINAQKYIKLEKLQELLEGRE